MLNTTIGQLAVNSTLPDNLVDWNRILDKKGLQDLLQRLAEEYPDRYKDVVYNLSQIGHKASYWTGGNSFGLEHLRTPPAAMKMRDELGNKVQGIYANQRLSDQEKELQVVETLMAAQKPMEDTVYRESLKEENPLAYQIMSGARGNPMGLKSLRAGDLLYVDHKDRPIPIPILKSYSQGLTPAEYYAGTFGTRKGVIDLKMSVPDAGALAKQIINASHRLVVTKHDHDGPGNHENQGLPVETSDPDNEGALLAMSVGGYPRNTVLRPRILSHLVNQGFKKIVVRSPIVSGPPDGGLYGRDVGYRERGGISPVGDNVGVAAAQALSEPLTQSTIGSKHSGGVAGGGKAVSGFPLINQLAQVPKTFKSGAAHAQVDGKVQSIEPAPQGGTYITVNGHKHHVSTNFKPKVRVGDAVEAGDVMSEGVPNPAEVVRHKGIGEGRRYYIEAYRNAYKDAGLPHHRRNIELISRALIDHVRMTDEHGHYIPGDIVPYSRLEHSWQPRSDAEVNEPKRALNHYLERPVLHYSIGTKIRPSVVNTLNEFGVKKIVSHKEPPPFEPEMVRAMESLTSDPDVMTKFLGSYQEKNLLKSVARGGTSDEAGTSYVPALSKGTDFAKKGPIQPWKPINILKA